MLDLALVPPRDLIHSANLPWSIRRCFAALLDIRHGSLDIVLPDGRVTRFAGAEPGPSARFAIHRYSFVTRLLAGDIGFAEGYIAGDWHCDDLVSLLRILASNRHLIERYSASPLVRAFQRARHWLNRNSRRGSRRNIRAHYDLGNEFYAAWLDRSMTYSSGLDVGEDLEASQRRKYAAIAAAAGIEPHHHVLEIGCGWGGFAEYAARDIGCRVTALTISREQFEYATARIAAAGLADRVEVKFCDYRDEMGIYDRIVSIEMLEAVGKSYWQSYFDIIRMRLKEGGRATLQVITIREDIFERYRREMDFIRHYIFPGGMLPTAERLHRLIRERGFIPLADRAFGADYAATCRLWRERFEARWSDLKRLGFDDRFRRMWRYYLSYCEAGFAAGTIDVCHLAFEKRESS